MFVMSMLLNHTVTLLPHRYSCFSDTIGSIKAVISVYRIHPGPVEAFKVREPGLPGELEVHVSCLPVHRRPDHVMGLVTNELNKV